MNHWIRIYVKGWEAELFVDEYNQPQSAKQIMDPAGQDRSLTDLENEVGMGEVLEALEIARMRERYKKLTKLNLEAYPKLARAVYMYLIADGEGEPYARKALAVAFKQTEFKV